MTFDNARIRRLRESSGLNQRDAAELAGLSQANWNRIETGRREPKLSEVVGMAAALGCLTTTILGNGLGAQLVTAMRQSEDDVDASVVADDLAFILETEALLHQMGYAA